MPTRKPTGAHRLPISHPITGRSPHVPPHGVGKCDTCGVYRAACRRNLTWAELMETVPPQFRRADPREVTAE